MKTSLSLLRWHFTVFGFALVLLACAAVVRADDVPTFSDPAVTAFAKDYGTFVDQYAALMKDYMGAVKANDTAKMQASAGKMQEFQTKVAALQTQGASLQGKVKPDEAKKFSDYMQACVTRLTDSMKQ